MSLSKCPVALFVIVITFSKKKKNSHHNKWYNYLISCVMRYGFVNLLLFSPILFFLKNGTHFSTENSQYNVDIIFTSFTREKKYIYYPVIHKVLNSLLSVELYKKE